MRSKIATKIQELPKNQLDNLPSLLAAAAFEGAEAAAWWAVWGGSTGIALAGTPDFGAGSDGALLVRGETVRGETIGGGVIGGFGASASCPGLSAVIFHSYNNTKL